MLNIVTAFSLDRKERKLWRQMHRSGITYDEYEELASEWRPICQSMIAFYCHYTSIAFRVALLLFAVTIILMVTKCLE